MPASVGAITFYQAVGDLEKNRQRQKIVGVKLDKRSVVDNFCFFFFFGTPFIYVYNSLCGSFTEHVFFFKMSENYFITIQIVFVID